MDAASLLKDNIAERALEDRLAEVESVTTEDPKSRFEDSPVTIFISRRACTIYF